MGAKSPEKETMNFEEALTSLEEVVNEIESNPLELEELVKRYERGMQLLKHCRSILDDTKKRLIILNQTAETPAAGLENDRSEAHDITDAETDDFSEFRLS